MPDKEIHTIIADAIGDPRYCPNCGSELEVEWDIDERGDRRCPDCETRYQEYTIEYLREILEPKSRGELIEQAEETESEVVKNDTVEADEDIDILRPNVDLRMERMSDQCVYVAGYDGGEGGNIDYRYWFTIRDGQLEIDREIVQNGD